MNEVAEKSDSTTVQSQLRQALDSGRLQLLQPMIHSLQPAEIADLLESIPPAKRMVVWRLVEPDDQGETLVHLADEVRAGLIEHMGEQDLLSAIEDLDDDDLADLVEDLPEAVTEQLLQAMDADERQRLQQLLSYPENSAGGLMDTDVVTVRPDVTLEVVQRYLRQRGQLPEHTDALFVVNRYGRYLGTVSLGRLLTLPPQHTIAEIMETEYPALEANLSGREVAKRFEDLDLITAPVVDDNGALLGRITVDDVLDFIRDEAEHSLLSMAGLNEEEDLFAPIGISARRRAIWLGINLCTAFMAAWVVGLFEASIEKVVALAVLMPIVASMGGIAGSQTLTLMIRGLATGALGESSTWALLAKEAAVSMLNGVVWGLLVGGIAWLWFGDARLAGVVAMALVLNQLLGVLVGIWLPLMLRKIGVDPALAGSVILTTFTDVGGFFALLGLGTLLLM